MTLSCSKDLEIEPDTPSLHSNVDVEPTAPAVHLIQATRRHVKFVCTRVLDPYNCGTFMFEVEMEVLNEWGLVIEDKVVEPDGNSCVTLAVHNCSLHTVRLEKGLILGNIQEATPINNEKQPRMHYEGCSTDITTGRGQ